MGKCPAEAEEAPATFASRLRKLDGGSVAAFLCGSVGLLLASLPPLNLVTKPLSGLGLLIGLGTSVWPAWKQEKPLGLPIAICGLCLFTLLFMGKVPSVHTPAAPLSVAVLLKPPPKAMAVHLPVHHDEWVDASTHAMQTRDLRVQIASVQFAQIKLKDGKREFLSPQKCLAIQLLIGYHGAAVQRLDYEPWADIADAPSKNPPVLTDASSRTYPQMKFEAATRVAGRGEHLFLTTGRQVRETLIFAVPGTPTEDLRLRLPAAAFGLEGEFRFRIPRAMMTSL
jgi:hypothetical protein